ncbi:Regulatory protein AfsR [Actinosynnema sp. ALI-1.44]
MVLAALAVDVGQVVATEQLVDRVWGERPPRRARQVISNYVSRLRHLADGAVVIERRGGGYALDVQPEAVDLHLFRHLVGRARGEGDSRLALELLERACALWRAEPLAGVETQWADAVRRGLELERFGVEHERVDLALSQGRHGELLPELVARAAAHPLDERVAGQLVLALCRDGRQTEALAKYEEVRVRLAEEVGADPGPALRELHRRVLTGEAALAGEPGVAEAGVRVPRQLPAWPRLFTGRVAELERLDRVLGDGRGTLVVSAVGGAGGIGKTWLAVAWAHRHVERFPDGQLFVDLRGFSPDREPMSPGTAVRGFLDALGVSPERLPTEPHAQAALFRSLVADRRVLIVLDNAADTAQVAPLLPGGDTCTVLVTSRNRLPGLVSGHSAHHLHLDVLSDDEARTMLVRRLGAGRVAAEPDAVADLVAFCGGFPLALGIVAAQAHTHPATPLAVFAAELRDLGLGALVSDDPAASLPAVLSWSLRALPVEQRVMFSLLGVAPGPDIGLPAAAALRGLPPARAHRLLIGLQDASLVVRDGHGRYRMHDLIRRYAAETARDLPSDVREQALRRVVDHYLHTAHAADRALNPHRDPIDLDPPAPGAEPGRPADPLAWFDAEHRCLREALHTAGNRPRTVWRLAWALTTFQQRRAHLHEHRAVWLAGLDAAERLGDPAARTLAHRLLGWIHVALRRHDDAVTLLRRALDLADDPVDQAHAHRVLTWAYEQQDDDRQALEHATRALDLLRAHGGPVWEARLLNTVGWLTARLGRHAEARDRCRAALALHRRHGDTAGEATTLDSLGYVHHHLGDHHRAVEDYRRALELFRTGDNAHEQVHTLDNLGHPLAALGRHDEARAVWREAWELYRAQGRDADARRVRGQLDALGG